MLKLIKENVDRYGEVSIKSVAESLMYDNISISEQKRLAKLIVKENRYVTERINGEIFVKQNKLYDPNVGLSDHETLIKWLIATMAGLLIFILFHIVFPLLKK